MLAIMSSCAGTKNITETGTGQSDYGEGEGAEDDMGKVSISNLHSMVTAENCSDYDFND